MGIAEQAIREFRARFIPDISHPEANLRVTAHGLLYDLGNYFPNVKFTVAQLQACLDAYLQLIDPLMQYIAAELPTKYDEYPVAAFIYSFGHDSASELLLAYFSRTEKDEDYPAFIQHVRDIQAREQVEHFLAFSDEDEIYAHDGIKRIFSIKYTLTHLIESA